MTVLSFVNDSSVSMHLSIILSLLFYSTHASIISSRSTNFHWQDCGSQDRKLVFHDVTVNPTPIQLQNEKPFFVSTDVDVLETLSQNTSVTVKITKFYNMFIWKEVVLLKQHSLCQWFHDENFGWFFEHLFKRNQDWLLDCEVTPKEYLSESEHVFDINNIPFNEFIVELIGSASFEAELRFADRMHTGSVIGCLIMKSPVSLNP